MLGSKRGVGNKREGGCSSRPPRTMPAWHFNIGGRQLAFVLCEPLGLPAQPYARRWVFDLSAFSIRLHHWYSSDNHRAHHDHSWWFATLVLAGRYLDHTSAGTEVMRPGTLRLHSADHRHWVEILRGRRCWTLLLTGPYVRPFGFLVRHNGSTKRLRQNKYFFTYWHHMPDSGAVHAYTQAPRGRFGQPGERHGCHAVNWIPGRCSPGVMCSGSMSARARTTAAQPTELTRWSGMPSGRARIGRGSRYQAPGSWSSCSSLLSDSAPAHRPCG